MSIEKLIDKLTDTEKRRLAEAETPEELDALLDGGVELSDDALGAVAGGCFRPLEETKMSCPNCGLPVDKGGVCRCGTAIPAATQYSSVTCPQCRQPVPASLAAAGGLCPYCGSNIPSVSPEGIAISDRVV